MKNKDLGLTIIEINKMLFDTEEKIQDIMPKYMRAEIVYKSQYYDYMLHSMASSAPSREAEAFKRIQQDDIFNTYQDLRIEITNLKSKKESYIEMSRNLRLFNY